MLIRDNKKIGDRLRTIRKRNGLSQIEAAEKAELSDRTYAEIERGNTSMSLRSLLSICQALNITPNDLLVDDDISIDYTLNCLFEDIKKCTPSDQLRIMKFLHGFVK